MLNASNNIKILNRSVCFVTFLGDFLGVPVNVLCNNVIRITCGFVSTSSDIVIIYMLHIVPVEQFK